MIEIKLKSVDNVRDLGGYKTTDGRTVKSGLLIRSASLHTLSDEDAQLLAEKYHLRAVVDFRSTKVALREPDKPVGNAKEYIIPLYDPENSQLYRMPQPTEGRDHLDCRVELIQMGVPIVKLYYELLDFEMSRQGIYKFFKIMLANEAGAVLWHCAQGKDRTGFAAALILGALGVDRETIMYDYMLSQPYYQAEYDRVYSTLRSRGVSEELSHEAAVYSSVDEKVFAATLDKLYDEYGGPVKYLIEEVGLQVEEIELFRGKFLE